jgi:hypothetical protein
MSSRLSFLVERRGLTRNWSQPPRRFSRFAHSDFAFRLDGGSVWVVRLLAHTALDVLRNFQGWAVWIRRK